MSDSGEESSSKPTAAGATLAAAVAASQGADEKNDDVMTSKVSDRPEVEVEEIPAASVESASDAIMTSTDNLAIDDRAEKVDGKDATPADVDMTGEGGEKELKKQEEADETKADDKSHQEEQPEKEGEIAAEKEVETQDIQRDGKDEKTEEKSDCADEVVEGKDLQEAPATDVSACEMETSTEVVADAIAPPPSEATDAATEKEAKAEQKCVTKSSL